jgi:hypothetical protein
VPEHLLKIPSETEKKALAEKNEPEVVKLGVGSLFKKANVRRNTLVLFVNWLVVTMGYYGISMGAGNLHEDIFVSYVLICLIGMWIECRFVNFIDNLFFLFLIFSLE